MIMNSELVRIQETVVGYSLWYYSGIQLERLRKTTNTDSNLAENQIAAYLIQV